MLATRIKILLTQWVWQKWNNLESECTVQIHRKNILKSCQISRCAKAFLCEWCFQTTSIYILLWRQKTAFSFKISVLLIQTSECYDIPQDNFNFHCIVLWKFQNLCYRHPLMFPLGQVIYLQSLLQSSVT
jgi:hypothetical protein